MSAVEKAREALADWDYDQEQGCMSARDVPTAYARGLCDALSPISYDRREWTNATAEYDRRADIALTALATAGYEVVGPLPEPDHPTGDGYEACLAQWGPISDPLEMYASLRPARSPRRRYARGEH